MLSLLIREKEGVWSKWLWVPTSTSAMIAATDRKKQITHLSLFYHLDLLVSFPNSSLVLGRCFVSSIGCISLNNIFDGGKAR
jgi:hypothetical protein